MFEITRQNAADYLEKSGQLDDKTRSQVRELSGGVSNVVLLVTPEGDEPFVMKQARGRLRVKDEWICPVERIWREVDVLRLCGEVLEARRVEGVSPVTPPAAPVLPQAIVPEVLWEDRDSYLYAMTAAPAGHCTWKELLLVGELESGEAIARACGELLAALHGQTWQDPQVAAQFDDRTFFDQLRLDPYYRQIARVHPQLAPHIDALIESVWNHRRCLVHGDFSPKNLLVWPGHLMLIDFEVGHYGDPAFDLGFFLTHLVLKSIRARPQGERYLSLASVFWNEYCAALVPRIGTAEMADLGRRMLLNLAGCVLARMDGKSPVDYLNPQQQALARGLASGWLLQPPTDWNDAQSAACQIASIMPP